MDNMETREQLDAFPTDPEIIADAWDDACALVDAECEGCDQIIFVDPQDAGSLNLCLKCLEDYAFKGKIPSK